MDEEIEDIVGNIKYTDSQNTVTTSSNLYSLEFTDSSSEKNNSSSKETYIIECDDSDYSEKTYELNKSFRSTIAHDKPTVTGPLMLGRKNANGQHEEKQCASTSYHQCSIIAQETCTQTSKTIIELAESENPSKSAVKNSLQTQTSYISITENKTVEYRIQLSGSQKKFWRNEHTKENYLQGSDELKIHYTDNVQPQFDLNLNTNLSDDEKSNKSSNGEIFSIIDTHSEDKNNDSCSKNDTGYVISDEDDQSDSDFEKDSLINEGFKEKPDTFRGSETSEIPKSVDDDVEELYRKLSQTIEVQSPERSDDMVLRRCGTLTPLTEEGTIRKESLIDVTPNIETLKKEAKERNREDVISHVLNINAEMLNYDKRHAKVSEDKSFRLPPIQKNLSCPNSPHISFLFTVDASSRSLSKAETLPCVLENQSDNNHWHMETIQLCSGESRNVSTKYSDKNEKPSNHIQLPPIHRQGSKIPKSTIQSTNNMGDFINITDKIEELKTTGGGVAEMRKRTWLNSRASKSPGSCRSGSPGSDSTRYDVADRGCDSLCGDLLRRLRSSNWLQVADTLDDIPRCMEKFWSAMTENRIADLIRQVLVHIESPRTQVARSACSALAAVLKNTGYTKKPEFFEAIAMLLVKTGSFNRAVRRAANLALDEVVCGVDVTHCVTALCVHGIQHKSPLVRCAAARLLVVCSALAGGGRGVLRARPAAAAAARRLALRALAALLDDKSTDVRKFAERLYTMLRPHASFEAFYLTDVNVELASRQMKKYDQLLMSPVKSSS